MRGDVTSTSPAGAVEQARDNPARSGASEGPQLGRARAPSGTTWNSTTLNCEMSRVGYEGPARIEYAVTRFHWTRRTGGYKYDARRTVK